MYVYLAAGCCVEAGEVVGEGCCYVVVVEVAGEGFVGAGEGCVVVVAGEGCVVVEVAGDGCLCGGW